MSAPLDLMDQLRARVDESLARLPCTGEDGLVSLVVTLPSVPLLAPELSGPQFEFLHGRRDELRAGYGIAVQWEAVGSQRLDTLGARARALSPLWRQIDLEGSGFHGFAFLGFAADPDPIGPLGGPGGPRRALPNALLWVPELALWRRRDQAAVILTTRLPVHPADLRRRWLGQLGRLVRALAEPTPEPMTPEPLQHLGSLPGLMGWQRMVASALEEIHQGTLRKAVLSRQIQLRGERCFDLPRLLGVLTWLFPSCQVIRVTRGGTSFVAATPERLVRVQGVRVEVDAIAGTAPRSASPTEDAALTHRLLHSEKDRLEHQVVVEALRRVLSDACLDLQVPAEPQVLRLHNAQHLWTPMSGRLADVQDLFDLARVLHPTPATNGEPRQAAREWLRRSEPRERGWYTGAAGVIEPDLSGELWVLLRCAELAGSEARLYAGAGIVAGSNPLNEWRETGHKLSAMATALRFA